MNIHNNPLGMLAILVGILAGTGWVYARICRKLAESEGFPVATSVALAVVITSLFYLWLSFFGFLVLLALIPAWLLERRRYNIHPR